MARKKGNNYIIDKENNIAKIELNRVQGDNFWVIIDLEDLEKVINFPYTWFAKYSVGLGGYYATSSKYLPEIKRAKTVLMHQYIMGIEDTTKKVNVDHKNHNTLDNRKANLRIINVSQNSRNRETKNKNNKSGYRNVSWSNREQKWKVQLQINGKNKVLGLFQKDELEKAGKFAKEMRAKYYGEYAGMG